MSPFRLLPAIASFIFLSSHPLLVQGQTNETAAEDYMYQSFKIGVGLPVNARRTQECTDEETEWMDSKFAEYVVELARLFFKDESLDLVGNFTPIDKAQIDWKAFDDFNDYERKKLETQPRSTIKLNNGHGSNNDPTKVDGFIRNDGDPTTYHQGMTNTYPGSQGETLLAPWSSCESNRTWHCATVDFEKVPGGAPLQTGQYVSDEWRNVYGMSISVNGIGSNAFTPNKGGTGLQQARLFDTSNPGKKYPDGNKDLGSPNRDCKNKGPGEGKGGKPEDKNDPKQGNCIAHGKVLTIQEGNIDLPLANSVGGEYTFLFDRPVQFNSIGLLNIHDAADKASIEAFTSGGAVKVVKGIQDLGVNSFQEIVVGTSDVVKLIVYIPERSAITALNFCTEVCEYDGMNDADDVDIEESGKAGKGSDGGNRRARKQRRRRTRVQPLKNIEANDEDSTVTLDSVTNFEPSFQQRRLLEDGEDASAVMSQDEAADDAVPHQRRLASYRFTYGAMGQYTCRFCSPDHSDRRARRNKNLRQRRDLVVNQHLQDSERAYLIGALESVMSFGLTVDLGWSVKEWLAERNIEFGCFGDGHTLSVVFELIFESNIE